MSRGAASEAKVQEQNSFVYIWFGDISLRSSTAVDGEGKKKTDW